MKKKAVSFHRIRRAPSGKGSALVIVLALVVLLTVVVLAMLSRSIFNGLLSNASANVSKADIYGHGVINQVIGDLKQEIVAGSTATAISPAPDPVNAFIYRPKTVASSVPYNSGPSSYTATIWNSTFPNLVKESTRGVSFYPSDATKYDTNPPTRAAAVNSATDVSRNGHYISPARWNKILLLPKATTTYGGGSGTPITVSETTPPSSGPDVTPVNAFVAPDWILTAADGSNPTTWPGSPASTIANPKSSSYVVGRYCYAIYNEGGLLDANVAGCMSSKTATTIATTAYQKALLAQKGPSAFADLTQLPGIAALTLAGANFPQQVVDGLIAWRNGTVIGNATQNTVFPTYTINTAPYPTAYLNYLLGISNNFMSTGNTTFSTKRFATSNEILTDRMFTSRQELISYMMNTVGKTAAEQSYLQDALMDLGTFSRTLNQPSYWPDPTRPKVVGPQGDGGQVSQGTTGYATSSPGVAYTGGNSAYGLDDTFNPSFKTIRVGTAFTRNDGTTAAVGEPLVKKRFALSRLMWLTYKGPSQGVGTSDALFLQYVNLYTGSSGNAAPAWLTQLWNEGTAANIKAYFGLTWHGSVGTIGGYWIYDHGITSGGSTILGSLSDVASAGREPDFFELLKAGITCGSMGSAVTTIGGAIITNIDYIAKQNSSVTPQIFQIGANIIDNANPTQYPTHIVYTFVSGDLRSVFGAMDLPYFTSLAPVSYIVQPPTIAPKAPSTFPTSDGSPVPSNTAITSATQGKGVILEIPSVWNPYDVNGPTATAALAPSFLRVTVAGDMPDIDATLGGTWPTTGGASAGQFIYLLQSTTGTLTTNNPSTTNYTAVNLPTENAAAMILANAPSLYREPTALIQKGNPSSLDVDPGSLMTTQSHYPADVTESGSNVPYTGIFMATFPMSWSTGAAAPYSVYTTNTIRFSQTPITVRMEYSTGGNTGPWIPYMEYPTEVQEDQFVPEKETGTAAYPYLLSPNIASTSTGSIWNSNRSGSPGSGATSSQTVTWDPRTSRWGTPWDVSKLPFIDSTASNFPSTNMTVTLQPGTQGYAGSHSSGAEMALSGVFEPSGGPTFGYKQLNLWSPSSSLTTDYYMDGDGVGRRASGAYVTGTAAGVANIATTNNWTFTANTTVGLMLAGTISANATIGLSGNSAPNPATYQSQSRPIILHRPYRSVAEIGSVFSDTPFRNVDFFTPESGYSALLDVFCINEDYRSDAISAGRVDLNTRQAPVIQALLAGAYRDEEANISPAFANAGVNLSVTEAAILSQALVKRTTVGGSNPLVSLTTPQPLFNMGDLVGRWITGSPTITVVPGNNPAPVSGMGSYDGFSADLAYSTTAVGAVNTPSNTPAGNFNIVQRFRETTMRALSDAGQAGTWNLLIDVVAQSGRYPTGASGLSDFLVEGEHRYWVHVAIDRSTGQIVDENIEPVNE